MAIKTINDAVLTDIATSIRGKLQSEDAYRPSEMADAIDSIPTGGGDTLGDMLAGTLENYTNNDINIIPVYAFYGRTALGKLSFPNATKIMGYAFEKLAGVREIYAPNVTVLDNMNGASNHFRNCKSLEKITLGNIKNITSYAFYGCTNLTEITNLDYVVSCMPYAFQECGIKDLVLKRLQSFRNYIFYNTNIETFRVEELDDSNSDSNIHYVFANSSNLKSIDLGYKPSVFSFSAKISSNFATGCSKLDTLIIRATRGVIAANSSGFLSGTKIAAGTGYIYVPSEYVDTYKAASNWSAYASQFRALEDYTVDSTITGELDPGKI